MKSPFFKDGSRYKVIAACQPRANPALNGRGRSFLNLTDFMGEGWDFHEGGFCVIIHNNERKNQIFIFIN